MDKREEPLDRVDALLFWINKICMLVRDDVERSGIQLKGTDLDATIPEMEDLYEDLCDGTCICALLAFYRPHDVNLQDIYFNDRSSLPDCRFNLSILKWVSLLGAHTLNMPFSENSAPSAFRGTRFTLKLRTFSICTKGLELFASAEPCQRVVFSFKPNVDAFLVDLFHFFEPLPDPPSAAGRLDADLFFTAHSLATVSPTQRRFVPIQGIPELRAQNLASRPAHPPRVKNYTTSQRDRSMQHKRNQQAFKLYGLAMSLASMDSLMTTRTGDSLRYPAAHPSHLPPNAPTTTFGVLQVNRSKVH